MSIYLKAISQTDKGRNCLIVADTSNVSASASSEYFYMYLSAEKCRTIRPPDQSAYLKIMCLISRQKHMLWVLKRTVSMIRFFWAPRPYVKTAGNTPFPHRPRIPWIATNWQIFGFMAETYSVRKDLSWIAQSVVSSCNSQVYQESGSNVLNCSNL